MMVFMRAMIAFVMVIPMNIMIVVGFVIGILWIGAQTGYDIAEKALSGVNKWIDGKSDGKS